MLLSVLCWGSWANTQKIDKRWRFELFYLDYIWGMLACSLLFGLTLGTKISTVPASFVRNLYAAGPRSLVEAFFGGVIFNLGNLLLVAAISVAGMALAFPPGIRRRWTHGGEEGVGTVYAASNQAWFKL